MVRRLALLAGAVATVTSLAARRGCCRRCGTAAPRSSTSTGASFFEHLQRHPDQYDVFQGSMAGRAQQEARDVVAASDFTGLRRLVDVGGGPAVMLAEILRASPELAGLLMDRENRRAAGAKPPRPQRRWRPRRVRAR